MNITITPDTYTPSIDNDGNYIDEISRTKIKAGLYCPCGSRKDKIYDNVSKFSLHIKTKAHHKWLSNLNNNKANYYVEMLKIQEVVEQQKKLLAQLEIQLQNKHLTIDYLTKQLTAKITKNEPTVDLLDIN